MKKIMTLLSFCAVLHACNTQQPKQGETVQEKTTTAVVGTITEPHRPQFHFTPPDHWMNDPNGMVYHNGEYHLFYQHYPDSTVWGPMHWGHAVSKDLVHWEHLPIALYPDSLGWIFSGSAVVDVNNTSGLGTKENPAMVALYTYHSDEKAKAGRKDFQTQGMAYSTDNGRSWTKFQANPVLKNPGIADFRDPKVSWYEKGNKWVMALAVADHVRFYSSRDLKAWTLESEFGKGIGGHGGVWECPDLFKLPIEGTNQEKWVLFVSINPGGPNGGSATQYFVGDFDGQHFVMDKQFGEQLSKQGKGIWLDYGRDNYAGVTWSNIPASDGRRLFMGWMSNWDYANVVPTQKWRSAMTVARSLTLQRTEAGLRVASKPVKELEKLRTASQRLEGATFTDALDISKQLPFRAATFELDLEVKSGSGNQGFALELSNEQNQKVLIGFDRAKNQYFIDRTKAGKNDFSDKFSGIQYAPRLLSGDTFSLRLLADVASVELFADGGKTTMTAIVFPDAPFTRIQLVSQGGIAELASGMAYELSPIYAKVK